MEIKKSAYQSLPPVPRAIAAYLAMNREDYVEADKLIGTCPRGQGQGKAFFGLRQALDVYNRMAGDFMVRLQNKFLQYAEALAFCEGWLAASGDLKEASFVERCMTLDTLGGETKQLAAQLEAVKEASREWADRNSIPRQIFSAPMAILNLGEKESDVTVDEKTLSTMRELFQEVTLTW